MEIAEDDTARDSGRNSGSREQLASPRLDIQPIPFLDGHAGGVVWADFEEWIWADGRQSCRAASELATMPVVQNSTSRQQKRKVRIWQLMRVQMIDRMELTTAAGKRLAM